MLTKKMFLAELSDISPFDYSINVQYSRVKTFTKKKSSFLTMLDVRPQSTKAFSSRGNWKLLSLILKTYVFLSKNMPWMLYVLISGIFPLHIYYFYSIEDLSPIFPHN